MKTGKKRIKRTGGGLAHPDLIPDDHLARSITSFLEKQSGRSHEICSLPEKVFRFMGLPYRGGNRVDVIGRLGAVADAMVEQGRLKQYTARTMTKIRLIDAGTEPTPQGGGSSQEARNVWREIQQRLARIELEENVAILYACESGSRAWGFASADSDWDVRFIYAKPLDWYLSIETGRRRDVIERPIEDDLDINGWDVRKALGLFRKSNPPLLEWLDSPIVYKARNRFVYRLHKLISVYYSFNACRYHYLSMAKGNYHEYLQGEQVRLKKYLYVLRPLLAVNWMEQGKGRAPVEFSRLLECVQDETVRALVDDLVQRKVAGNELGEGPRVDALNQYIERELGRLDELPVPPDEKGRTSGPLNDLFRVVLKETWGDEE